MRWLIGFLFLSLASYSVVKPSFLPSLGVLAMAQEQGEMAPPEDAQEQDDLVDFESSLTSDDEIKRMMEARTAQLRSRFAFGSAGGALAQSRDCKFVSGIGLPPPANTVVLTFDDGPSASTLPQILEILAKYSVQATFFWTGKMAQGKDHLLADAQRAGHIVANHSFSHPNFHSISPAEQTRQIIDTDNILARFMPSGQKFFRYPYGNSSCHANEVLRREGYSIVGWHVDSCDWAFARSGSVTSEQARICGVSRENQNNFARHVVDSVVKRTGGILLFHDVHQVTVRNLENIIRTLQLRGYQFVSLADPRYRPYLR